jgi:hypothetical protein
MSFPKLLLLLVVLVFGTIGGLAWMKQRKEPQKTAPFVQEIKLEQSEELRFHGLAELEEDEQQADEEFYPDENLAGEENVDRINELFNLGQSQLPFVETITYHSKVSWLQDRPAWIADYASYYGTSRHFIARSLNRKVDYLTQKVAEGDRFNVLRRDKDIRFYLLLDTSRCKMWFYALDGNERIHLKTYKVGLGRPDKRSPSGCLTPLGKYTLGSKVAIFKPGMTGQFNNQQTEMIRVFGTRWLPFDKELGNCSAPAKGYGIHGAPWDVNSAGEQIENKESLSKYESDGCVRLATEDIEEIFAIIITKPTTIEIVNDVSKAQLPGRVN